jgi:cell division protein FtsI (penicillin-binding protein 3)
MREVLAYSLNLGSVHVAMELGADRFYDSLRRFGFGEVTGIDLGGEVPGSMRIPGSAYWSMTDLATNSFGQGLSVTPIQMISAVSAVANHGLLMKPYVVSSMVKNGQVVWQATPQAVRQVIKPEVADELTDMLIWAMPEETPLAVVPGYTSAGKTGTAQVAEKGGYGEKVIVSFAGYLPAKDPRFAVLVKLDEPTRSAWGSQAAAPVWRSVATDLCTYLGVPPDRVNVGR